MSTIKTPEICVAVCFLGSRCCNLIECTQLILDYCISNYTNYYCAKLLMNHYTEEMMNNMFVAGFKRTQHNRNKPHRSPNVKVQIS